MKRQLLPEMEKMYKTHCHKMDSAMKNWVSQYNTGRLQVTSKITNLESLLCILCEGEITSKILNC